MYTQKNCLLGHPREHFVLPQLALVASSPVKKKLMQTYAFLDALKFLLLLSIVCREKINFSDLTYEINQKSCSKPLF